MMAQSTMSALKIEHRPAWPHKTKADRFCDLVSTKHTAWTTMWNPALANECWRKFRQNLPYMNGARLMSTVINQYSLLCKIYMKTHCGVLSYVTGNDTQTEGVNVVIRSLKLTN